MTEERGLHVPGPDDPGSETTQATRAATTCGPSSSIRAATVATEAELSRRRPALRNRKDEGGGSVKRTRTTSWSLRTGSVRNASRR